MAAAQAMQSQGFDVRAIRLPSVPAGTARLRITVNANLDDETIGSGSHCISQRPLRPQRWRVPLANSRGLFVTGTDTGVGKTVVSAALMIRLRPLGSVCYWKPIQTGIEQDDDTAEVASLAACSPAELLTDGVRLRRPLSPHLAARLSDTTIELDPLVEISRRVPASTHLVVEGAGGALVPINDRAMMTDLIARLALPVIIAARSGLGTITTRC
jgi:dethiobiotin synthase